MNKIRQVLYLGLALCMVLGLMGVGYSLWSDTVTINGQINTGNVQIGIRDIGTNDDGSNLATITQYDQSGRPTLTATVTGADPQCGATQGVNYGNPQGKDVGSAMSTQLVKDAKCLVNGTQFYSTITETFSHVYPGYAPCVTIQLGSCGSVPVKIENIVAIYAAPTSCTNPVDLIPWMGFSWTITDETNAVTTGSGTIYDLNNALHGLQIAQGKDVQVVLCICFNEWKIGGDHTNANLLPQNSCASYNLTVTGSQYNEVT